MRLTYPRSTETLTFIKPPPRSWYPPTRIIKVPPWGGWPPYQRLIKSASGGGSLEFTRTCRILFGQKPRVGHFGLFELFQLFWKKWKHFFKMLKMQHQLFEKFKTWFEHFRKVDDDDRSLIDDHRSVDQPIDGHRWHDSIRQGVCQNMTPPDRGSSKHDPPRQGVCQKWPPPIGGFQKMTPTGVLYIYTIYRAFFDHFFDDSSQGLKKPGICSLQNWNSFAFMCYLVNHLIAVRPIPVNQRI
jgi:hypothetical protein